MYGLYLWYKENGRAEIWQTVERAAGYFMNTYYIPGGKRMSEIGCLEMNLAPLHIFALLYKETGDERYLAFCKEIISDLDSPEAGGYISHTLEGGEFYTCRKPRWESMHIIMGLAEVADCLNEPKYFDVALDIFNSILRTDVHNTGGFSTNEQAVGNPFEDGAIELCCVIAFNALASQLYMKTGDPRILDFLEISHYNAIMGSFSPSGRWSTYNTPMDGSRRANYHDIVFQSRAGSPDLNCCSANSAKGLAQVSQWAVTCGDGANAGIDSADKFNADAEARADADAGAGAVYINFYESMHLETPGGIMLSIESDYPFSPVVHIKAERLCGKRLFLRIPEWSACTMVKSCLIDALPAAGEYYEVPAEDGAEIQLTLDFTPRYLKGALNCAEKSSLYIGPILFAWDNAMNPACDFASLPELSKSDIEKAALTKADGRLELHIGGIRLVDFYHAGHGGSEYKTWLNIV